MKKVLLAGTALVGVALMTTAAHADLKLDLGGYFRGYGVYADNDELETPAPGNKLRSFEMRRDTEVHFTGETTTDMGLTVGFHSEMQLGNEGTNGSIVGAGAPPAAFSTNDPNQTDEVYAYFSGSWGRVNLGVEDGAAYLLQVASPSADSNVDGLRTFISGINMNVWDELHNVGAPNAQPGALDYQHADFRQVDRLTYLTPKFNGFQAGLSYTPSATFTGVGGGLVGMSANDLANQFDNMWEGSARWDGEFQGFGISAGGGYSHASAQNKTLSGAGAVGSDDLDTWNGGLTVSYSGFSLGGAYKWTNSGITGPGLNGDVRTWNLGGAWDNGPYHVGASYINKRYKKDWVDVNGNGFSGLGASAEVVDRWTIGGGYTFAPGMTFRGSFGWGVADDKSNTVRNVDFKQGTIGTDIQF